MSKDEKDKLATKEKGGASPLVKPSGAPDIKAMKRGKVLGLGAIVPSVNLPSKHVLSSRQENGVQPSLQILLMFDLTGSMFKYFNEIRSRMKNIISTVQKQSPDAEFAIIAYRNHGDEVHYKEIYYVFPFTKNQEELFGQIVEIRRGGGGTDALTCLEDCLREANKLKWQPLIPKAIVLIGDMPPHGVIDDKSACPQMIDYLREIQLLKSKAIKVYSVYCQSVSNATRVEDIRGFYHFIAEETKGKFLEMAEIDILVELLIGICMKETGNLDEYQQKLEKAGALSAQTKKAILMLTK